MKKTFRYIILRLPAMLLLSCILFACANIGNPNGGPYDEDPPRFIGSKPAANQLNFKGKKIEIFFDEYITIDNPSENVIITPPQKQSPSIQAVGKKAMVELRDTLKENTTYTIDFTSSIVDNNEKNALDNFSFAFSTGDVLDTLRISGTLISAEDLEPVQKVLVGIHNDLSDTAFTKTPLLRTSKTDERGRFVIHNVSPGSYHAFALEDKNRNYSYDKNNDESLAFLDSIVVPTFERAMVPDTIWKDTITVDTVLMVEKTLFYPNDLILWYFKDSIVPKQRMFRPERSKEHIFTLKFNAPMDTFPKPVPLNFEPTDSLWYVTQKGEDPESFAVNYWILDSMIYKMDTLQVGVAYWRNNDTVPDLMELQTDTLNLVYREVQGKKKDARSKRPVRIRRTEASDSIPAEPERPPVVPLQVGISPSGPIHPYDIIAVAFNEPVMDVRKEYFVMEIGADSLWEAVDFEFEEDSIRAMTYLIKRPFKYNENYRLTIDSAALCGVYGHCNNFISTGMTVKGEKEYGHLIVSIHGLPFVGDSGQVTPAFMELLGNGGEVVRKAIVKNGSVSFVDMPAEKYYARITLDTNGNGRWDAGNYEERRQPERVVYFMRQFEIRQNWKIEEAWDISDSVPGEKPGELIKNKPKEETKRNRNYKDESKPRKSNSSSMNVSGLRL
ncbi:MAG: Ig-like domain-containing protein [Tannerella sp.]|jgi:hypothetical protein|nr:Ig-like domain-containing protein [Tannerella sp.]